MLQLLSFVVAVGHGFGFEVSRIEDSEYLYARHTDWQAEGLAGHI